jgi:hypothetical protein
MGHLVMTIHPSKEQKALDYKKKRFKPIATCKDMYLSPVHPSSHLDMLIIVNISARV